MTLKEAIANISQTGVSKVIVVWRDSKQYDAVWATSLLIHGGTHGRHCLVVAVKDPGMKLDWHPNLTEGGGSDFPEFVRADYKAWMAEGEEMADEISEARDAMEARR